MTVNFLKTWQISELMNVDDGNNNLFSVLQTAHQSLKSLMENPCVMQQTLVSNHFKKRSKETIDSQDLLGPKICPIFSKKKGDNSTM